MTDKQEQEQTQPAERKVWAAPVLTEINVVGTTLGSYFENNDGGGGYS